MYAKPAHGASFVVCGVIVAGRVGTPVAEVMNRAASQEHQREEAGRQREQQLADDTAGRIAEPIRMIPACRRTEHLS